MPASGRLPAADTAHSGRPGVRTAGLGYQESTTLGEIMTRDVSSAARRHILV
jgi:hypothetical protein